MPRASSATGSSRRTWTPGCSRRGRGTVAALTEAEGCPREMSEVSRRRRDLVAEALTAIGLHVEPPKATPYFWVRVPEGYTSEALAELALEQAAGGGSPGP